MLDMYIFVVHTYVSVRGTLHSRLVIGIRAVTNGRLTELCEIRRKRVGGGASFGVSVMQQRLTGTR